MTNVFQGTSFDSRESMIEAIAYEFMTAGGNNSPEQVTDLLLDMTDEDGAADALGGWELGDVTQDELALAIADFRANRPDMAEA